MQIFQGRFRTYAVTRGRGCGRTRTDRSTKVGWEHMRKAKVQTPKAGDVGILKHVKWTLIQTQRIHKLERKRGKYSEINTQTKT